MLQSYFDQMQQYPELRPFILDEIQQELNFMQEEDLEMLYHQKLLQQLIDITIPHVTHHSILVTLFDIHPMLLLKVSPLVHNVIIFNQIIKTIKQFRLFKYSEWIQFIWTNLDSTIQLEDLCVVSIQSIKYNFLSLDIPQLIHVIYALQLNNDGLIDLCQSLLSKPSINSDDKSNLIKLIIHLSNELFNNCLQGKYSSALFNAISKIVKYAQHPLLPQCIHQILSNVHDIPIDYTNQALSWYLMTDDTGVHFLVAHLLPAIQHLPKMKNILSHLPYSFEYHNIYCMSLSILIRNSICVDECVSLIKKHSLHMECIRHGWLPSAIDISSDALVANAVELSTSIPLNVYTSDYTPYELFKSNLLKDSNCSALVKNDHFIECVKYLYYYCDINIINFPQTPVNIKLNNSILRVPRHVLLHQIVDYNDPLFSIMNRIKERMANLNEDEHEGIEEEMEIRLEENAGMEEEHEDEDIDMDSIHELGVDVDLAYHEDEIMKVDHSVEMEESEIDAAVDVPVANASQIKDLHEIEEGSESSSSSSIVHSQLNNLFQQIHAHANSHSNKKIIYINRDYKLPLSYVDSLPPMLNEELPYKNVDSPSTEHQIQFVHGSTELNSNLSVIGALNEFLEEDPIALNTIGSTSRIEKEVCVLNKRDDLIQVLCRIVAENNLDEINRYTSIMALLQLKTYTMKCNVIPHWLYTIITVIPWTIPLKTRLMFIKKKHNKIKIQISRQKLMASLIKIIEQQYMNVQISFYNEVGTGVGCTNEFYTLCCHGFKDTQMQLFTATDYPLPYGLTNDSTHIYLYKIMGSFIAQGIINNYNLELEINLIFLKLLLRNITPTEKDLKLILPEVMQLVTGCRGGMDINEFHITWHYPGTAMLLRDDLENEIVTNDRIDEYVELLLDATFNKGIKPVIEAMKQGIAKVIPMTLMVALRADELYELLTINSTKWTVQGNNN
eukprot:NODE_196_length_15381_cov_0.267243.p1 type:complete len:953 gc:universal NODE_196_length_15381_cov_0.267243:6624-3766(-)